MREVKVTTTAVKEKIVWAAVELMRRAGLDVVENRIGDTVRLTVIIPPESTDPHGDRLKALKSAQSP